MSRRSLPATPGHFILKTWLLAAIITGALLDPAIATPGDPDPTFGSGGAALVTTGQGNFSCGGTVIQPDGKIVVAGTFNPTPGGYPAAYCLVRFLANGTLDASFGSGGVTSSVVGDGFLSFINDVTLQPDGKIVVAGVSDSASVPYRFTVARFHTDGSLDGTFGTGGIALPPVGGAGGNSSASVVTVLGGGKILAAGLRHGGTNSDFAVVRLNADGSLDSTFGTGGMTVTAMDGYSDLLDMAVQSDGKIVVSGELPHANGDPSTFILARYQANGTLDTAGFGTGGIATTQVGGAAVSSRAHSLVLQAGGQILAVGSASYISGMQVVTGLAMARYNADGSPDAAFGTGGWVADFDPDISLFRSIRAAAQGDGKVLIAGQAYLASLSGPGAYSAMALVRCQPDGSLDTSFGNGGMTWSQPGFTSAGISLGVQPDGRIVVAGDGQLPPSYASGAAVARFDAVTGPTPEVEIESSFSPGVKLMHPAWSTFPAPVALGGTASCTLTIRNIGAASLTGVGVTISGADAAEYSVASAPAATIPAGGSTTCTVQFSPASLGQKSAIVQIASNDANENPFQIKLAGEVSAPEIEVEQPVSSPLVDGSATVVFNASSLGASAQKTFTIRNAGNMPLTGLAVTKDGSHAADFAVGTPGAATLAAGESTTFTVTFTAGTAGLRSAALHIASNDADENPFDINLGGQVITTVNATGGGAVSIPSSGDASPYPSTLAVSGFTGTIAAVRVKLNGVSHTWPDDMDIHLVAPSGKVVALMSDAGGSQEFVGADLVFDDAAASPMPQGSLTTASGTYQPTDYDATEGLPPGATGPITTSLDSFAGISPNGGWKLFVRDDTGGDSGSITSWSLVFDLLPPPYTPQESWRLLWFGTAGNTGNAADNADPDGDGLNNFLEWACGLNPTTSGLPPQSTALDGSTLEFSYQRSIGALNAGTVFTVEWSDTLPGTSWSSSGVTQQVMSDNGTVQQVKATVPAGSSGKRFVQLRVVSSP